MPCYQHIITNIIIMINCDYYTKYIIILSYQDVTCNFIQRAFKD